jgi:hypothetical protein
MEEHVPSKDGVPSMLSPSGASLKLLSCKVTITIIRQFRIQALTGTHPLLHRTDITTYFRSSVNN